MSVKIHSRFSRPVSGIIHFGDGTEPIYEERIVEGVRKLVETGRTNVHEFIQKSLPDTLIYNIIAKFERGNVDILNQRAGQYVDITGLPKTLAEAENIIIKSNRFFDSLPLDVRNRFGNSSSSFLSAVSDGSISEKVPELFKQHKVENPIVNDGKEGSNG